MTYIKVEEIGPGEVGLYFIAKVTSKGYLGDFDQGKEGDSKRDRTNLP